MSLWVNRLQCKDCGSEINVQGGMVGQTWMGPADSAVVCPNPSCNKVGLGSFKSIGPMDLSNPDHKEFKINHNHSGNAD